MNNRSRVDRILAFAAIAIIVTAPVQWSFSLGFGGAKGTKVTPADLLLALTCILLLIRIVLLRSDRPLRFPTPSCVAMVLAGVLSMSSLMDQRGAPPIGLLAKEIIQLIEYFLVAYAVLINSIVDRDDLRRAVAAFLAVTGIIVALSLWQYSTEASLFEVRGTFGNRNVLSVYLALSLPVAFGLALCHGGCLMRTLMIAMVFVGVAVCLSGGPLIGLLLGLAVISALRGRVFVGAMVLLALVGGWLGSSALRPGHVGALTASVAPFVRNNHLLDNHALLDRAEELIYGRDDVLDRFIGEVDELSNEPQPLIDAATELKDIHSRQERQAAQIELSEALVADKSIPEPERDYWEKELRVAEDCERYDDARRLLTFVREDIERRDVNLGGEDAERFETLYKLCKEKTRATVWKHGDFGRPVPARRYLRWQAAINALQNATGAKAYFGRGAGTYNLNIIKEPGWYPGEKLHYDTDEPEVFNLGSDEADTFGQVFVTASELGIFGVACLIWVWLSGLSKSVGVWYLTRDTLHRGLATGIIGSMVALPLCALYSGVIIRGIALPLVFLLVCGELMRRFEMVLPVKQESPQISETNT